MVIAVSLFRNITLGSDVFSVRVKVWFSSNAPSSIIVMSTHLAALSVDPKAKILEEVANTKSVPAIATFKMKPVKVQEEQNYAFFCRFRYLHHVHAALKESDV